MALGARVKGEACPGQATLPNFTRKTDVKLTFLRCGRYSEGASRCCFVVVVVGCCRVILVY